MLPQSYISRCIRAFRTPQLHPCHPAQSVNVQHQPTCRGIPDGIPETLKMKKALENQGLSSVVWRRGGDSNPRGAINACLISSQVHSTALPPLQMVPANRDANNTGRTRWRQVIAGKEVNFFCMDALPDVRRAAIMPLSPAILTGTRLHDRIRTPDPPRPAP